MKKLNNDEQCLVVSELVETVTNRLELNEEEQIELACQFAETLDNLLTSRG